MQPQLLPLDQSSQQERLIVITRDLVADASAVYVARLAMAGARRGERVCVVLTGEALASLTARQRSTRLGALAKAGVRLLRLQRRVPPARPAGALLGNETCIEWISDEDLGALLLRPGMHCQWC